MSGPMVYAVGGLLVGLIVGGVIGFLSGRSGSGGGGAAEASSGGKRAGGDLGVEMYVGNLAYNLSDKELGHIFGEYGEVVSVRIIKNRMSGKSKGYGFVGMATSAQVDAAIKALNGTDVKGRKLVVSAAKSKGRDDE
jgi:hypothetical protein